MIPYLTRRAVHSAGALLGLLSAVFFLARLTGDPTDLFLPLDATHTFDQSDHEGATISADEIARITRSNLDPEFCRVVGTEQLIAELRQAAAA